jgi:hypothetical protein
VISALSPILDTDVPIIVLRRKLQGKSPKAGFVEFRAAAISPYPGPGNITSSRKASTNTSKPNALACARDTPKANSRFIRPRPERLLPKRHVTGKWPDFLTPAEPKAAVSLD